MGNDEPSVLVASVIGMIKEYNKFESIFNSESPNQFRGNLIEETTIQNWKKSILYNELNKYAKLGYTPEDEEYIVNNFKKVYIENNPELPEVRIARIRSEEELIKKISSKSFAIVDENIQRIISNKNVTENCLDFTVEPQKICIFINNRPVDLKNNQSNIISKDNLMNGSNIGNKNNSYNMSINHQINNEPEIDNIYNTIKSYYEFEQDIKEKLVNQDSIKDNYIELGYIIALPSLQRWKRYYGYDSIKIFFDNHEEPEAIKKQITNYRKTKGRNYKKEDPQFETIKNRENFIKNLGARGPFAIVKADILNVNSSQNDKYTIQYYVNYGEIDIILLNTNETLKIKANNNIISTRGIIHDPSNQRVPYSREHRISQNGDSDSEYDNTLNDLNDSYRELNRETKRDENKSKVRKSIRLEYQNKVPPEVGFANIGATCYMNATLQCFCRIEKLANFFLTDPHPAKVIDDYKRKGIDCLTESFQGLMIKAWPLDYVPNKVSSYEPYDFKNKISKMDPLFEGVQANDSKDLVNFIIINLHNELNKANNQSIQNNTSNIDQANSTAMLELYKKDFNQKNKSIISEIFYATNCSISKCLSCKTELYTYQTYFFLIFPLEEVRKYKQKNNNTVNIYDCFDYSQKTDELSGLNSAFCNECQKSTKSTYQTILWSGPEILIILLNRGKGIQYDVKLEFYEHLNLKDYIKSSQTGISYKLIGVITHLGQSSMSGHFIACCRNPITGKWFKYNDNLVTQINSIKSEIIDYAMPYILFYQKN